MIYYDRQGQPITMTQWAKLHANMGYRRVAETNVPDDDPVLWAREHCRPALPEGGSR